MAKLARIELTPEEKERFSHDLENILNYFKELETLNTKGVEPMTGWTELKSIFREDGLEKPKSNSGIVDQFPDKKDGFLRVPEVFGE